MIDIPLGKALVPIETDEHRRCENCYLLQFCIKTADFNDDLVNCVTDIGRGVIFKLVDYPVEVKK